MLKLPTEKALRKRANKEGYAIQKTRTSIATNSGEYRLVNRNTNFIEMGQGDYPLSFEDLISWFGTNEEKEEFIKSDLKIV